MEARKPSEWNETREKIDRLTDHAADQARMDVKARDMRQKECSASEYGSRWLVEWYGGDPEDPEIVAGPFDTEQKATAWISRLPA